VSVPLLELRGLEAGFGKKPVLRGVDLSLAAGETFAVAGPNGSGKTTLLKTAAGIIKPLSGKVFVEGRDGGFLSKKEWALRRAYIFQAAFPSWPFTVYETVAQGRHFSGSRGGKNAVERAVAAAGLEGFEDRPVTELSGGEYQRVLIARAMAQEVKILILDEPCGSLDPKYRVMVMDLLGKMTAEGAAVLVSLHDRDLAVRYAGRAVLLYGGTVHARGAPEDIFREGKLAGIF
jgi:iron complex transport system ATP-binding protein